MNTIKCSYFRCFTIEKHPNIPNSRQEAPFVFSFPKKASFVFSLSAFPRNRVQVQFYMCPPSTLVKRHPLKHFRLEKIVELSRVILVSSTKCSFPLVVARTFTRNILLLSHHFPCCMYDFHISLVFKSHQKAIHRFDSFCKPPPPPPINHQLDANHFFFFSLFFSLVNQTLNPYPCVSVWPLRIRIQPKSSTPNKHASGPLPCHQIWTKSTNLLYPNYHRFDQNPKIFHVIDLIFCTCKIHSPRNRTNNVINPIYLNNRQ